MRPVGTKYRTTEFDGQAWEPLVGAAMASFVSRETTKFSVSQLEFLRNSMQSVLGDESIHSSISRSNRRLKAVQSGGKET